MQKFTVRSINFLTMRTLSLTLSVRNDIPYQEVDYDNRESNIKRPGDNP